MSTGYGKVIAMMATLLVSGAIVYTMLRPKVGRQKVPIDLASVPRLVMAFYHDWYGNTTGPTGAWVHWNHPIWDTASGEEVGRYDPEVFASPGRRDIGATNYPMGGPYDNRDPELLRMQIGQAHESGIDVIIIDWWGDATGAELTDGNMEAMVELNDGEGLGMKFAILLDGLYAIPTPSPEDTIARLEYAIGKYGNRPSYLRVQGLPVVFVFSTGTYPPETWDRIIGKVIDDGYGALFLGDAFSEGYAKVFDGLQTYSPVGWMAQGQNITEVYLELSDLAQSQNEPLGLAVLPGYDDTKVRRPGMVIGRGGGATYNSTWRAVFASGCQWVLICSWNEWHEGTEIEPSLEYADYYLKLTRHYSRHFKAGTDPFKGKDP